MRKIIIIGCGGSGKSTMAKKLGSVLNIPVVHLDKVYWTDHWKHVSKEVFDSRLNDIMSQQEWILDGKFTRTISNRLEKCNTVIYLDLPRYICLFGAIKRIISNYGRTRSDMGENCPEKFDFEFLKWIWNFNKENRDRYYTILKNTVNIDIFIIHKRKEINQVIQSLLEK